MTSTGPTTIVAVETIPLRIPLAPDATPGAGLWGEPLSGADALLVKVTTADGRHGWGEAFGYTAAELTRCAVDTVLTPLCLGRDAAAIGALMTWLQHKLHVFGRGGPITYALSAIDIALWDLAGKRAGVPVYELLGGAPTALPCYASLACYSEPDLLAEAIGKVLDAGFGAIKLHESRPDTIQAARDVAGPDVELILDAGCSWSLADARALEPMLTDLELKFLEEPLWPPENFAGLAQLRADTGLPVSSGENVGTLIEFERMLAAGAVDVVQPSPAKLGGITEVAKVFPLAAVHNAAVAVHSFYDGPGLLAAAHLGAALGGPDAMVEWRWFETEAPIYGDALAPVAGRLTVPGGPGLGVDPDPEVIGAYRCG